MEITLKQTGHERYLTIMKILGSISNPAIRPFNVLRHRELEVFAILVHMYNETYSDLSEEERFEKLFSYETRIEISTKLGHLSMDSVYNIMMNLRKHGLITKTQLVKGYILPKTSHLKINFE